MTSPGLRSITRNTGYLVGTQAIGVAARTIWVIVAARLLGPDLYALLAYSQAWQMAFLPLALFGLGSALAYIVAPDRGRARDVAAQALALRLVTTAGAAAASIALSRAISPDPRASLLIAVLAVALVGRSLTAFAQTLFLTFEVNQYTLRQEAFFRVLDLAVALAILLAGGGPLALVSATAAVSWLQAGRALLVAHRRVVPVGLQWRPASWRPLLSLAAPAFLIALTADWRFNGCLVLFRNLTTDGVLFAQFALAMQALAIAGVVPVALANAAHPVLRRSAARGDGQDLRFASVVQRAALIAGAAAGLLGLALGEPLFRLLFGEAFTVSGRLVGRMLWCLMPLAAGSGYAAVLIARGQFRAQVIAGAAGALLMSAAMALLAPGFGVNGAIAAAFIGFAAPPTIIFGLAWRQGIAHPGLELFRPLAAAGLALGVYLLLAPMSRWAALGAGLLTLAAAARALGVIRPGDLKLPARA